MIIRLNTIFDKYIGTLDSWRVDYKLNNCAEKISGADSVKKDSEEAFVAQFTVKSDYDLSTLAVVVTMDGSTVSGAYTVDGNTVTVTIAEVTGRISIELTATKIGGGDEPDVPDTPDEPDEPVTPDDSTIIVAESGAILQEGKGFATGDNYSLVTNADYYAYEYNNDNYVIIQ